MHRLGRTTHNVHSFSAHTIQEGIKCTKAKEYLESILISNPCNMYHIYARYNFKSPAELLWHHSLWSRLNFRLGIQVELWQLQNRFFSYFFLTFLQRAHLFNTIDSKYVLGNRLSRPLNDIYDFCKRYDVTAEIQSGAKKRSKKEE